MQFSTGVQLDLIVGSLVTPGGVRPFMVYLPGGPLTLDEYEPQAVRPELTDAQSHALQISVREMSGFPIAEVRFGEYLCRECQQWVDATHAQWSLTMCLSCSLERGTELREHYEERH